MPTPSQTAHLLGVVLAGIASLWAAPTAADSTFTADVRGYVEARYYGFIGLESELAELPVDFDEVGLHPDRPHGFIARFRPTLSLGIGEHYGLVTTVQAWANLGFFDRGDDSIDDIVTLERLQLYGIWDPVTLIMGKIAPNWGTGLVYNPTDLFNSTPTADLRFERLGVWGAELLATLNEDATLSLLAATPEEDCCDVVATARMTVSRAGLDATLMVAYDQRIDSTLVGVDLRVDAGVGLLLEATYTAPFDPPNTEGYLQIETGIDYTFDVQRGLYVAAEVMYLGDGATNESEYFERLVMASDSRQLQIFGRLYAVGVAQWRLPAEWKVSGVALVNLDDDTARVTALVDWAATDWLELTVAATGWLGPLGGEYRLAVPQSPLVPEAYEGLSILPRASLSIWSRFYL